LFESHPVTQPPACFYEAAGNCEASTSLLRIPLSGPRHQPFFLGIMPPQGTNLSRVRCRPAVGQGTEWAEPAKPGAGKWSCAFPPAEDRAPNGLGEAKAAS